MRDIKSEITEVTKDKAHTGWASHRMSSEYYYAFDKELRNAKRIKDVVCSFVYVF